eukprot:gnl/MRDRNA2_/MRDRNA2_162764_c0_seq1.p1 gnl/MRDRNA2_/MRDRNA2_162764_c0~~gnl/MRDRNA2_/MRDRNA2_162764_c0_seq1.p1  ORF type:complete len:491 (-),score=60.88 gnl/MRDRNA2_/MRDRNA2_162764_c0_seq1:38-1429(-)
MAIDAKTESATGRTSRSSMSLSSLKDTGGERSDLLVCSLADGSMRIWAMAGDDRGEVVAELRSLKFFLEVFVPIALEIITMCQLSVFAFSPEVPWNPKVAEPPRAAASIVTLDLEILNEWAFKFEVPKSDIVYSEMAFLCVVMLLFIFCAWCGVTQKLDEGMRYLQGSEEYRAEEKARHAAIKQSLRQRIHNSAREATVPEKAPPAVAPPANGWAHTKLKVVKRVDRVVEIFMFVTATIMVVPVVKITLKYAVCEYDDEGRLTLKQSPDVVCFQGMHLFFESCLFFIGPVFIVLLLPYVVVKGQGQYVQTHELCQPKSWVKNAMRLASSVDRGFLTLHAEGAFTTEILDFCFKVLVPCVTVLTTQHVFARQVILTVISLIFFFMTILNPVFVDSRMVVFRRTSKAVVFLSFLGAVLSEHYHDESSLLPFQIAGYLGLLITAVNVVWYLRQPPTSGSSLLLKLK